MSKYGILNSYENNAVSLKMSRSKFNLSSEHLTTFSSGYWFPVHCLEVLPGDTFSVKLNELVRMLTPVVPTMDNLVMELACFFVPNRLACRGEHDWEQICVGSEPDAWTNGFDKDLITTGNTFNLNGEGELFDSTNQTPVNVESQSLASYLGIPIGTHDCITNISSLPFRAVFRIWNEWLRDENLMESIDLASFGLGSTDGAALVGNLADSTIPAGSFLRASKLHDYFTSALPAPQKGGAVFVPIGDKAPVGGELQAYTDIATSGPTDVSTQPLLIDGQRVINTVSLHATGTAGVSNGNKLKISTSSMQNGGLYADLSNAVGASVNAIRLAFAVQRLQEKLARGGSRYNEYLKSVFGVNPNPGMLQMSEFLGGTSVPINITQVLQTSSSDATSPLGSTGAFSNTFDSSRSFVKSFVEYGYFIVMCTVRPVQSYSQGLPIMFRRMSPLDIYSPTFAFIGEQPIYTEEIYFDSSTARYDVDDGTEVANPLVFGYKEAWNEYKNPVRRLSGNFVPAAGDATLAPWTYTSNFESAPILSKSFMEQPASQVGDTLIDTETKTQFFGDFVAEIIAERPMPAVSIPGLVDHF